MHVTISELGAHLAAWVERARGGEEVVITARGVPVARLVPIDAPPLLDQLTDDGILGKPRRARPSARKTKRVRASGPVAPSPETSAGSRGDDRLRIAS